jgi:hypothetical protein
MRVKSALNLGLAIATAGSATALVLVPGPTQASSPDLIRAELLPSQTTFSQIGGALPGGAPWVIDRGEVRVRADGRMDVSIMGLQIPAMDGSESNPVASVNAVLYCGGAQAADSGPQPLSVPGGDARFRVDLSVPETCDAAAVLISPTAAVGVRYIAFTPVPSV